jgi:hypothetical protein
LPDPKVKSVRAPVHKREPIEGGRAYLSQVANPETQSGKEKAKSPNRGTLRSSKTIGNWSSVNPLRKFLWELSSSSNDPPAETAFSGFFPQWD